MNVKSFNQNNKKYFILTEGRDDQQHTFKNVTITDGDCAWKAQDISFNGEQNWSGVKEALCEQQINQVQELQANLCYGSDLQLQWRDNLAGKEDSYSIILNSCEKQPAILNMLDILVNSFQVVKVIQDQMDTELSQYKEVAQRLDETERQMQEMYQRFAVIINEKKRQVRYFAEKAGMIDDKGVFQIPEDEKEQIPKDSILEESSPEKEDEMQREDQPTRDIMEMDTQPIPEEDMIKLQAQINVDPVEQTNEQMEQPEQEQKLQEDEPTKPVIDIVKVVKRGGSKRGRGKRR